MLDMKYIIKHDYLHVDSLSLNTYYVLSANCVLEIFDRSFDNKEFSVIIHGSNR